MFDPVLFIGALLLFSVVAIGMLLAPLVAGWFLRPAKPNAEKDAIYECGEPTIGPSNVQFDLRFYVVALLFIVFDVEVAFFFPWAVVFGKANALSNPNLTNESRAAITSALTDSASATPVEVEAAQKLMKIAFLDLLLFFVIVLVGFAYVWKRGDLDWVRAMAKEKAMMPRVDSAQPTSTRPMLVS